MPPIGHFFLGYSLMFLILLLLMSIMPGRIMAPSVRTFLYLWALPCIIAGLWAMFPDTEYFVDLGISDKSWTNVFLFHYSLDRTTFVDDLWFSVEVFVLFASLNFYSLMLVFDPKKVGREVLEEDEGAEEGFRYLT